MCLKVPCDLQCLRLSMKIGFDVLWSSHWRCTNQIFQQEKTYHPAAKSTVLPICLNFWSEASNSQAAPASAWACRGTKAGHFSYWSNFAPEFSVGLAETLSELHCAHSLLNAVSSLFFSQVSDLKYSLKLSLPVLLSSLLNHLLALSSFCLQ